MRFERPSHPSDAQTIRALRAVGGAVGAGAAHVGDGTYWFILGDEWALGLSPDDAGRFRLRACYGRTEIATMWAQATDTRRLADLARSYKVEIEMLRRS